VEEEVKVEAEAVEIPAKAVAEEEAAPEAKAEVSEESGEED
jgi:hypothetical protein